MAYHISGGKWGEEYLMSGPVMIAFDGDFAKVELEDFSPDDGGVITRRGIAVGRRMKADFMPTKVRREGDGLDKRPLLDVDDFHGQPFVCKVFKDIVEELEPDVHQFFPMEVYVGNTYQRTDYFWNICNRISAIHRDKTFPLNERGFWKPKKGEPSALVFSTERIGNHHAWRDKFQLGCFISDVLGQRLKDAEFTGISYQYWQQG